MEVFRAKFDYEKEREDILSFKEGELFRIASKADSRWWAAYAVSSGNYGYVPSQYLEAFVDPVDGELAQKLAESSFGENKKVTLDELKQKVPRTQASASNQTDGSEEESGGESGAEVVVIKPLTVVSQVPEDCVQIEGKRLPNPHQESKTHVRLHKELKLNNAKGGAQNLGKPELEKVMQRRRLDADGRPGAIRNGRTPSPNPTAGGREDNELAAQLKRRTQLLEDADKQTVQEQNKPEFLKVALRKTPVAQSS